MHSILHHSAPQSRACRLQVLTMPLTSIIATTLPLICTLIQYSYAAHSPVSMRPLYLLYHDAEQKAYEPRCITGHPQNCYLRVLMLAMTCTTVDNHDHQTAGDVISCGCLCQSLHVCNYKSKGQRPLAEMRGHEGESARHGAPGGQRTLGIEQAVDKPQHKGGQR